jgi:hypothetical protein
VEETTVTAMVMAKDTATATAKATEIGENNANDNYIS